MPGPDNLYPADRRSCLYAVPEILRLTLDAKNYGFATSRLGTAVQLAVHSVTIGADFHRGNWAVNPDQSAVKRASRCDDERTGYHPAWIRETSKRDYLTAMSALNLRDPDCWASGDWHRSCWQVPNTGVPERAHYAALSGDKDRYAPVDILEDLRLCDIREPLRGINHPAGFRSAPVWGAHHERAIADLAWHYMCVTPGGFPMSLGPVTVAKFLWTDTQFDTLHKLLAILADHLQDEHKTLWMAWKAQLTPDADYM